MGYTHNFTKNRNLSKNEWKLLCKEVKYILDEYPKYTDKEINLTGCCLGRNPLVNKDFICLNGSLEVSDLYKTRFKIKRFKCLNEWKDRVDENWTDYKILHINQIEKLIDKNILIDNRYDTFLICRNTNTFVYRNGSKFNFCKTARKPYDLIVNAILIMAVELNPNVWTVLSDGFYPEWLEAQELLQKIYNTKQKFIYMDNYRNRLKFESQRFLNKLHDMKHI